MLAGLVSLAGRTPVPVRIQASDDRYPGEIEAAAYFVACEAIANAVKHAQATQIRVSAQRRNGWLCKLATTGLTSHAPGRSGRMDLLVMPRSPGNPLPLSDG